MQLQRNHVPGGPRSLIQGLHEGVHPRDQEERDREGEHEEKRRYAEHSST